MGFADVKAAAGTLESLVTLIALARIEGPVFYPAGKHLSGDMAHALAPHGLMVVTATIYDMVAQAELPAGVPEKLESGEISAVLVYSQRTAEIFCAATPALSPAAREKLALICMSEKVARPLLANHFTRVHLSDHPDEDAMMTLALAFAREQTGP
jgi:uroporphyrinogen-III synthase